MRCIYFLTLAIIFSTTSCATLKTSKKSHPTDKDSKLSYLENGVSFQEPQLGYHPKPMVLPPDVRRVRVFESQTKLNSTVTMKRDAHNIYIKRGSSDFVIQSETEDNNLMIPIIPVP